MVLKFIEIIALLILVFLSEIKTNKIKNSILLFFSGIGIVTNAYLFGLNGVYESLLGFIIPILILSIVFMLIGNKGFNFGGGVIKLFATLGSLMGVLFVFYSFAYSMLLLMIVAVIMNEVSKRTDVSKTFLSVFLYPNDKGRIVYSPMLRFTFTMVAGTFISLILNNIPIWHISIGLIIVITIGFIYFKFNADFPDNHYNKGYSLYISGKYEEAIKHFDLAIKKDTEFIIAYRDKSYCYYILHNYEECINTCEEILKIDSSYKHAYYDIGSCLYKCNRIEEALSYFCKYIELDPECSSGYYSSSCVLALLSRVENSLEYLKKALDIDSYYAYEALEDDAFNDLRDNNQFKQLLHDYLEDLESVHYDE